MRGFLCRTSVWSALTARSLLSPASICCEQQTRQVDSDSLHTRARHIDELSSRTRENPKRPLAKPESLYCALLHSSARTALNDRSCRIHISTLVCCYDAAPFQTNESAAFFVLCDNMTLAGRPYTDEQKGIIAVAAVLAFLSTGSTGLRFFCRKYTSVALWWDDWLVVVGLVLSYALCADLVVGKLFLCCRRTERMLDADGAKEPSVVCQSIVMLSPRSSSSQM